MRHDTDYSIRIAAAQSTAVERRAYSLLTTPQFFSSAAFYQAFLITHQSKLLNFYKQFYKIKHLHISEKSRRAIVQKSRAHAHTSKYVLYTI